MDYKKILNDVKVLLSMEVKLEQMKLDNGTIVEADVFEANAEIFIITEEERIPLPIGEYVLEDGRLLVVTQDGIIGEVKEANAEEEAPATEEVAAPDLEAEKTTPKKIIESISKEQFFEEIEKLKTEISELKLAKVEEVEVVELEEVKPVKHSVEKEVNKNIHLGKESLVEFLNNRKK
jgi:hypothetical protein